MSIADELQNYADGLGDAYDAVDDMGGVTPPAKNMNNLDAAIRTIPQPVVNDGTLTIQKNGTTVQTFTANQASNATANITVPTATSDLTNDSGFITSSSLPTKTSDLTNDGSDGTSTYVEADDLATVATTGSYTDLTNTPSIPAAQVNSDWNASSGVAQILNKPNLATVATSGSYTDLSNTPTIPAAQVNSDWNASSGVAEILNKPTIPTVYDGTLTIQHNGTSKGTFTANQSTASTVNIETIYADTVAPASSVGAITTTMIADGAVTQSKINLSTLDAFFYKAGDTYTPTSPQNYAGMITASVTKIYFTITTPKRLDNITSVACSSFVGGIRPVTGGYLASNNYDFSQYITRLRVASPTSIDVIIDITDSGLSWSGTAPANNTPISLYATPTLTFN